MEQLKQGQLYTYTSQLDERHPEERWIYSYEELQGEKKLTSTSLDYAGRINIQQVESIVETGALLDQLQLLTYDSLGQVTITDAEIQGDNIFPFAWQDTNNIVFYKISYPEPGDSETTMSLIVNRSFGGFTSFDFDGRTYPAMRMMTQRLIQSDNDGSIEIEVSGEEIFAKGMGRVAFSSVMNGDVVRDYVLSGVERDLERDN